MDKETWRKRSGHQGTV